MDFGQEFAYFNPHWGLAAEKQIRGQIPFSITLNPAKVSNWQDENQAGTISPIQHQAAFYSIHVGNGIGLKVVVIHAIRVQNGDIGRKCYPPEIEENDAPL